MSFVGEASNNIVLLQFAIVRFITNYDNVFMALLQVAKSVITICDTYYETPQMMLQFAQPQYKT